MTARAWLLLFVVVLTVGRLWVVFTGEVSAASAYAYACGEHPAPAYFDGPAGTALTVRAAAAAGGTWWLALGPAWAVLATLACRHLALRAGVQEPAASVSAIALNCIPAFHAASFEPGPAMPALALALVGTAALWSAAREGGVLAWLAGAAAFAGAACFSYAAGLAGISAALGALRFEAVRRKPAGVVLVVVAVLAASLPALLWNAAREWIPMSGWTPRGLLEFSPAAVGQGLVLYALAASPLMAVLVPWASTRRPAIAGLYLAAAVPGAALALLCIYRGWPSGEALLLPFALALPAACAQMAGKPATLGLAMLAGLGFAIPAWMATPSPFRQAAAAALAIDENLSPDLQGRIFFVGGDPGIAAAIGYHLRNDIIPIEGHPRVYALESQGSLSQFAYWPSYAQFVETAAAPGSEPAAENPFIGHAAIYIGREAPENLPQTVKSAFTDVQLVRQAGNLYIYLCLDYQTMPL